MTRIFVILTLALLLICCARQPVTLRFEATTFCDNHGGVKYITAELTLEHGYANVGCNDGSNIFKDWSLPRD